MYTVFYCGNASWQFCKSINWYIYFSIYNNGGILNATIPNSMMTALLKFTFVHGKDEDIAVVRLGFVYHSVENLMNVQFSQVLQHRIFLMTFLKPHNHNHFGPDNYITLLSVHNQYGREFLLFLKKVLLVYQSVCT